MIKAELFKSKAIQLFCLSLSVFFLLTPHFSQAQDIDTSFKDFSIHDNYNVVINFLAGLVLFLFGITNLSNGIRATTGERVKNVLSKFTSNRFAGLATGFLATTILDSSSLVIIMVIALVNARALNSSQSLGVVLGANIGTTVSSQIIAFDLSSYAPIAMFIGFMIYSLGNTRKIKKIGLIVFGAGMIFYGLKEMGEAMKPLKDNPMFIHWMQNIENPLLGIVVGGAFTVVIQSSSATLGVVISLANQGMISLLGGIALMMGAELGTCADTLVATIGRSRDAVRVVVFHLAFNIISVLLGLIFFTQFHQLIAYLFEKSTLAHQIANAHFLFNTFGAFIFIGFTPLISRGLNKILPSNDSDNDELEITDKEDETILVEKN